MQCNGLHHFVDYLSVSLHLQLIWHAGRAEQAGVRSVSSMAEALALEGSNAAEEPATALQQTNSPHASPQQGQDHSLVNVAQEGKPASGVPSTDNMSSASPLAAWQAQQVRPANHDLGQRKLSASTLNLGSTECILQLRAVVIRDNDSMVALTLPAPKPIESTT